jgi:uncharacterized protein YdhG (YjbR/CyaY superfamily)
MEAGIKFKTVDEYIATFDQPVKGFLQEMRKALKKAAPKAEEVISYNMPAIKANKVLVYYAGYKQHIGFYPLPSSLLAFKKELAVYKSSKGAVQFPMDTPLPLKLIGMMVKYRLMEDAELAEQAKAKKQKKKN